MPAEPNGPGSVFITGCSRGIGLGLAARYAEEKLIVFAAARRVDLPSLRNLEREFPNLHLLPMDVTEEVGVAAAFQRVGDIHGSLDLLINNAAVFPGEGRERLEELDPEWFEQAFDVNVTGVVRVTKAALPLLRKSPGSAKIVNISSGSGSISAKDDFSHYPYAASKAALNMFTRCLAMELLEENIPVVAMSPGWVRTGMGGDNAPLSVGESVASMVGAIRGICMSDTGCFLARDGGKSEYVW
jgi:NAD(P)-dependent dehydrogenase (short-subunit alcohol dehydrogenase family)